MQKETIKRILDFIRNEVGQEGLPLHPKHGWGGFLDKLDKENPPAQNPFLIINNERSAF